MNVITKLLRWWRPSGDPDAEAESERLLSNLPEREPLRVRHTLALACYRLASWLDRPGQYFQSVESGGEDWAAPCAHA
jgi:hypothetical protein